MEIVFSFIRHRSFHLCCSFQGNVTDRSPIFVIMSQLLENIQLQRNGVKPNSLKFHEINGDILRIINFQKIMEWGEGDLG